MILGRVIRPDFYIYALFVLQKSEPNKRLLFRSPQLRLLANATSKDRWTIMDKTFRWAKPNGLFHFFKKWEKQGSPEQSSPKASIPHLSPASTRCASRRCNLGPRQGFVGLGVCTNSIMAFSDGELSSRHNTRFVKFDPKGAKMFGKLKSNGFTQ